MTGGQPFGDVSDHGRVNVPRPLVVRRGGPARAGEEQVVVGAAPSPDDYWRVFATALAVLTAEFRAYLDREDVDPPADLVGFRQHAIWLSRENSNS